jgi:malonate decarboxylase gamma subunit
LLWETLSVNSIEDPAQHDLQRVRDCLVKAVEDIGSSTDLRGRLGALNREASSRVRELLRAQW